MPNLRLFSRLLHDERGTSAVEYGLILALIVLVVMLSIMGVAGETLRTWNFVERESAKAHAGN
jgi:pilus assembly protein Flp/PilA